MRFDRGVQVFIFNMPVKIYMGAEALASALYGLNNVLIVTDMHMYQSGKVKYVTDYFGSAGVNYSIFSDVRSDPDTETVASGIEILARTKAENIVAFGGGSVADAAKAIKFFAESLDDEKHYRLIVIPTTSGTGSEVSRYSVISDTLKQIKYPIADDRLMPEAALLDAGLTLSVPPAVTADTGIDVLTHAIESFVSKERNDFSDAMAEKAIKLIHKNLHRAYSNPDDIHARQAVHNAACMAGIAFSNSGLGLNHAMAHALGAKFHVPHGRANGIFLTYTMNFNAGCSTELTDTAVRYAEIAAILDVETSALRQSTVDAVRAVRILKTSVLRQNALGAVRAVRILIEKLHIPTSVKDAGISRRDFEAALDPLADAVMADPTLASNPIKCSRDEVVDLFRKAYNGEH